MSSLGKLLTVFFPSPHSFVKQEIYEAQQTNLGVDQTTLLKENPWRETTAALMN